MVMSTARGRAVSSAAGEDRSGSGYMALALMVCVSTLAFSGAQAQVLDEQFTDDLQKDPSTTADWDTVATELKLPTTLSLVPVQSLTGSFDPAAPTSAIDPSDASATRGIGVGDLNGDGFVDLVFANSTANRVYFNDGAGVLTFTRGANITGGGNSRSVAIADFNGDGHMDVVFAEFGGGQASRVHFNNGGGVNPLFDGDGSDLGDPSLAGDSVAVGDIDNDGDIDVVLGFDQSYVQVFRNDGFGNFSDGEKITDSTPEFGFHARAVLLGDLDGDGDLDVVAARELDPTRVYLNDGNGNFGSQQSVGGVNVDNALPAPDSATLGDVNGDGLPDLFVGNDGSGTVLGPAEANYLFINSGNPADLFPSLTFSFADFANTNAARFLDFDQDGDLDLVTADYVQGNGNSLPGPNRVYLNDGAGNFPANGTEFTVDSNVTKSMAFGDFDGDGDLDLVFGNEDANLSTAVNRIVENVGVPSGTAADQLFAFGESLDIGAGLGTGVFLDPSTSAAATDVESERVFKYWLSDDGGLTWIRGHRNRSVGFPAPVGNTIRWRVEFDSPSPALRPTIGRMLLRVNAVPSFTSTAVTTATQDVAYQYDITASDSQNDILDIRATATLPGWLTLTDNGDGTATLAGTPASGDVAGPNDVEIEVVDGAGQGETQSFSINVTNVNDAPTVSNPTGDQVFSQGDDVNLDASAAFEDPDGDTLTYSATGLPASLSIATDTGVITGTLTNADAIAGPDYSVTVTADDGNGGSADDTFTLTVNNVNDAPEVVAATADQGANTGATVSVDAGAAFSDPDGDTLTYAASGLPASLSIDTATGVISGTLTGADLAGSPYTITVTADDGNGGTVDDSFTLTVTVSNNAPTVVTPPSDQSADVGTVVNIDISTAFEDADGDTLTFSATGLPASLSLDANTGVVTGTLTDADRQNGPDYTITVTADDGNGGTVDASFTLTVTEPAPPPPPPPPPPSGGGGGGATSLPILLLLAGLALGRRCRRRFDA